MAQQSAEVVEGESDEQLAVVFSVDHRAVLVGFGVALRLGDGCV
jgi:hypothetical protein